MYDIMIILPELWLKTRVHFYIQIALVNLRYYQFSFDKNFIDVLNFSFFFNWEICALFDNELNICLII